MTDHASAIADIERILGSLKLSREWAMSTTPINVPADGLAVVSERPAQYQTTFSKPSMGKPIPSSTTRGYWRHIQTSAGEQRSAAAAVEHNESLSVTLERMLDFVIAGKVDVGSWWAEHPAHRAAAESGI
ncbi:hypothetical protein H9P43_007741 [Blastocladiella emersonii ATCC 22665]|nr:hypothetical protein H9P43_007741 [Blastocladiella emersonii ATCC 22665]